MAERIVTSNLQITRETLQVFMYICIYVSRVQTFRHVRRHADNPFPPIHPAESISDMAAMIRLRILMGKS